MIAIGQQHFCKRTRVGLCANSPWMAEPETDRELLQALAAWANLSLTELARRAGLTPSTLTRPVNFPVKHRLSTPTLQKLRDTFPDFPAFRAMPDMPPSVEQIGYVSVDVLPTFAGMGGGGTGDDDPERALVPRRLIEDELNGHPQDFRIIRVRGNSMEPLFYQGDELLIDLRDRNPIQPGPFALLDGDAYFVKLVERAAGKRGWYRVSSKNPDYSDDLVEETETTIMGRPVWFSRRL